MKKIYNVLVYENCTAKVESLLNRFKVGLNNWDRSKTFDYESGRVVNYTIMCDDATYESIITALTNV